MAKFVKGQSGNPKGAPKKKTGIEFFNINHVKQEPTVSQVTKNNKPFIFFGYNNLFPQKLIHYYDNVNTHRRLVNKIVKYIAGKGFIFEGDEAKADKFLMEATGGKPKRFLKKTAFDTYMFNGFYWNMIYQRDGNIAEIHNTDFSYVRIAKPEDKHPENYWFSVDWEIATGNMNPTGNKEFAKPIEIPIFNPLKFREAKDHGQMWLVEDSLGVAGKRFYTEPLYMAVTNWLDVAAKISDLHKNNLDNGMVGGMHIHLFEDLSDPTKRESVESGINEKFAGTNNASKVVVTWSTNEELKPDLTPIPTNNTTEMAIALRNMTNAEILQGHDVPPIIAGEDVNTGISGKALGIRESLEMFQETLIDPLQSMITEAFDQVLAHNKINATTKIKDLNPFKFKGVDDKTLLDVLGRKLYAEKVLGMEDTEMIPNEPPPKTAPNGS